MKCSNCGKEIPNDSIFCEACGARIKKSRKALWIILSVVLAVVIAVVAFTIIKKEQEHQARLEAERKAELVRLGYVDLGLPSGTLWKNTNEGGDYALYTYDEAINMFGNQLPTVQQLEELRSKCTWSWIGDGYEVICINGNSITLPAAGLRFCNDGVGDVGTLGNYWSSTPDGSDYALELFFSSSEVQTAFTVRCAGCSVRLVQ